MGPRDASKWPLVTRMSGLGLVSRYRIVVTLVRVGATARRVILHTAWPAAVPSNTLASVTTGHLGVSKMRGRSVGIGIARAIALTVFMLDVPWSFVAADDFVRAAEEVHLLQPIAVQDFLTLPDDLQAMYVAGLMEGMAFVQYGYSIADYPKWIECVRRKSLGDTTTDLVAFLRHDPSFKEGVSSAFSQMLGRRCAH